MIATGEQISTEFLSLADRPYGRASREGGTINGGYYMAPYEGIKGTVAYTGMFV